MDVKEIRKLNINHLADKFGRSVLAKKLGYEGTVYINQLCGGHGSFGDKVARKIEKDLSLAHGWMDKQHDNENSLRGKIVSEIESLADKEKKEVLAYIEFVKNKREL